MSHNGITNCPNCGAPLGYSDKCSYCGSIVRDQNSFFRPVEYVAVRPGMRKLDMQSICRIPSQVCPGTAVGEQTIGYMTDRLKNDMAHKLVEQLGDAIKFTLRRDCDPRYAEEIIMLRGELWVGDPDYRY